MEGPCCYAGSLDVQQKKKKHLNVLYQSQQYMHINSADNSENPAEVFPPVDPMFPKQGPLSFIWTC